MHVGVYPIAFRPGRLRGKGKPRTWTDSLARENFDWLMSVRQDRPKILLTFLGLSDPSYGSEYDFLLDCGARVATAITTELNCRNEDGRQKLTAPGLSIAHELGLLLADLIIRSSDGKIKWTLLRSRRDALSYNLPVLSGTHPKMTLDPIRGSITGAKGILSGVKSSDLWAKGYRHWLKVLLSRSGSKALSADEAEH